MKTILTTLFLAFSSLFAYAQTSLSGKITDEKGEPLFAGNIVLIQNGRIIMGAETDFDGNYSIIGLEAGIYDVRCSYTGMEENIVKAFVVKAEKANVLDFVMESHQICNPVVNYWYKIPLISLDMPTSGATYNSRDVQDSPFK
jgi:Carboxypeptidase regulatory-like domain